MELLERINSAINIVTDKGEDVVTLLSMDGLHTYYVNNDTDNTRERTHTSIIGRNSQLNIDGVIYIVTDIRTEFVNIPIQKAIDSGISLLPLTDQYGTRPRNFQIEYIVKPLQ